jgi:hypothetical protein
MPASPDIDAAIDRLDDALRVAGLPGLEPPDDPTPPIEEITEAVAPYLLPAELRRFWERAEADRIAVFTFPMLHGPAEALGQLRVLHEVEAELGGGVPPLLLPFDYASHCYGVIELVSEWSEGGTIFEFAFDDVQLVSYSLADRIDLLAELLAEGRFDRGDDYVSLDHGVERQKRVARLEASGPHPVYGVAHALPTALQQWPAHWLAASGIDLRDREPLGATHTIAELRSGARAGPITGRVHADVTRLVGIGTDVLVVIDDGSGSLDVWCPGRTSLWGPVHRGRFEFQLTIDGPVQAPLDLDAPQADATRHALAGDLGSAEEAVVELLGRVQRHRPSAVATDIRPLD